MVIYGRGVKLRLHLAAIRGVLSKGESLGQGDASAHLYGRHEGGPHQCLFRSRLQGCTLRVKTPQHRYLVQPDHRPRRRLQERPPSRIGRMETRLVALSIDSRPYTKPLVPTGIRGLLIFKFQTTPTHSSFAPLNFLFFPDNHQLLFEARLFRGICRLLKFLLLFLLPEFCSKLHLSGDA